MKKKSVLSLMAAVLALTSVGSLTSCEDVIRPENSSYVSEFNGRDTVSFYLGIMRNMQDLVENNLLIGELRSDLVTSTDFTSDSVANIMNFNSPADGTNGLLSRAAYYKVINQCNFYLAKADTMSSKNGYYYMRRETAQVLAARAWTYLQLVQTYGEAPFITEPVSSANTGLETSAPKINADNMVDLLKADLLRSMAYQEQYGKVNYGNYNTGAVELTSVLLNIPPSVVLADMYLFRGNSTADYETAAQLYYDYLRRENGDVERSSYAVWSEVIRGGQKSYTNSAFSWMSGITSPSYSSTTDEVRTFIPSAANSAFGKVLAKGVEIFGFDVTSINNTSTATGDDGKSTSTTSGSLTIAANYRKRQVAPSNSYLQLNKAQQYSIYKLNALSGGITSTTANDYELEYYPTGDARLEGTAPLVYTTEGNLRFIQKFGGYSSNTILFRGAHLPTNFNFRYGLPIYRIRKIYLNYAEAINRAGFPRHAFAVLRDGLGGKNDFALIAGTVNKIPALTTGLVNVDDAAQTADLKYYVSHVAHGLDYLSADELRRAASKPYLNFSSSTSFDNVGIHELGSGTKDDKDSVYTYANIVSERILAEATRNNTLTSDVQALVQTLQTELYVDTVTPDGVDRSGYTLTPAADPKTPSAEEINAVETLILDEMALEAAYEGYRMGDLIRVARHKNAAGTDGTNWLAWKIARRNVLLAPYEQPTVYDAALYGKLQNTANWYLRSPQY